MLSKLLTVTLSWRIVLPLLMLVPWLGGGVVANAHDDDRSGDRLHHGDHTVPPDKRTYVFGGDMAYPPFEFINAQGKPDGFSIDLVRAVGAASGLDIRIRLGEWADMVKGLEQGDIDVLGMFFSADREKSFAFSTAYAINHCVGVVRKGTVPAPSAWSELKGRRIVVQNGDLIHTFALQHGLDSELTVVESQLDALRSVAQGAQDCALVSRAVALRWTADHAEHGLVMGQAPLLSAELCFAVANRNRVLLAALTDGLKAVEQSGEYRRIEAKWLGVATESGIPLQRILRYAAAVALPVALLVLGLFGWNWMLRRQVAVRTADLQCSEARFRQIYEHTAVGIARISLDSRIEQANEAYCQMLGYTEQELIGRHVSDITVAASPEAEAKVRPSADLPDHYREERQFIHKDGHTVYGILDSNLIRKGDGAPDHFLGSLVDITERKQGEDARERLRSQLVEAQKLESIGRLAGGVAHDFNNLLMGIMGYAELCRDEVGSAHPVREWLDEIIVVTRRSADLTRQLLAFARKQTITPRRLVIDEAAAGLLKMLRRIIGEDIELTWIPGAAQAVVCMDPSQMDQILTNLCINARDAIAGVGKITITTGCAEIDADYCAMHSEAVKGRFIVVSVGDNGCGIPHALRGHIFEPFFTTKEVGDGFGMGLATVYGIVKQNNGFIQLDTEVGRGTTFRIYLPLQEEAGHEIALPVAEAKNLNGDETILFVEDEAAVRTTAVMYLKALGYHVLSAGSPEEALALAARAKAGIDLLITDIVMPGMNGRDLSIRLCAVRPSLRCLYISGYTAEVIASKGMLDGNVNFLEKPFAREVLAAKVREVLDAL